MPPEPDETALRREGAAGVPVTLGDGRTWLLAKPVFGIRPVPDGAGGYTFGSRKRAAWPGYAEKFDAFVDSEGADSFDALLALAVDLLKRNYPGVDDDAVAALLPLWPDDPANAAMWKEIRDVAVGVGPKPSPVG